MNYSNLKKLIFTVAALGVLLGVAACGVKPSGLKAPGDAPDTFPHTYPDPATDPGTHSK